MNDIKILLAAANLADPNRNWQITRGRVARWVENETIGLMHWKYFDLSCLKDWQALRRALRKDGYTIYKDRKEKKWFYEFNFNHKNGTYWGKSFRTCTEAMLDAVRHREGL